MRLFAQHNYGVGGGLLTLIAFINFAAVKYFCRYLTSAQLPPQPCPECGRSALTLGVAGPL